VWTCAVCNKHEDGHKVRIEAVCHHCGRPLCHDDRERLSDDAFSDLPGPTARDAFHCKECRLRHHGRIGDMARIAE
jgi:hypothetical protein